MVKSTCIKCVMDYTDPDLKINESGICNHCEEYKLKIDELNHNLDKLNFLVNKIKSSKRGEYDCIIGLSGGVDSTYVAHLVVELGLKPLAIHFDNGWNSTIAVSNIKNIVEKLNIDLITYVVDWEEFADIQKSFFFSGTPDIEIPTDHAIFSVLRKYRKKFKIRYVINGINFRTESHHALSWSQGHSDWKYIKSIHKKFGKIPIKTFPHGNFFSLFQDRYSNKWVNILDFVLYDKEEAKKLIIKKYNWEDYGGKHFESVFTRFYQGYYLLKKFGYDKRKMHLSSLICSGKILRDDALVELKKPTYPLELQNQDLKLIQKKLKISPNDWDFIMNQDPKTYFDYSSYYGKLLKSTRLKRVINAIKHYLKNG